MGKADKHVDEKAIKLLLSEDFFDPKQVRESYYMGKELSKLQVELFKLQSWVIKENKRVAILFEGRDASGRGGTIRKMIRHMNPRHYRVHALPKPTETEQGQWYFQRYISRLPDPGEIVFFDRSWYNRSLVEPVMGFCKEEQYTEFLEQVPQFEKMINRDGIAIIKFWYELPVDVLEHRLTDMKKNPLRRWKVSTIDEASIQLYDSYSDHRDRMFKETNTKFAPWIHVDARNREKAAMEAIKYVLRALNYDNREDSLTKESGKIVKKIN